MDQRSYHPFCPDRILCPLTHGGKGKEQGLVTFESNLPKHLEVITDSVTYKVRY